MSRLSRNFVARAYLLVIIIFIGLGSATPSQAKAPLHATAAVAAADPCAAPEMVPAKLQRDGVPVGFTKSNWWYIVVNFNATTASADQGIRIQSCLRAGSADGKAITVISFCQVNGDVQIRRGVAYFNGGYIECDPINIGEAGKLIDIPVLGDTKSTSTIWMGVKGSLAANVQGSVPLLRYVPLNPDSDTPGVIAIHLVAASKSQPEGFAETEAVAANLQGPGLTLSVNPQRTFTGLFKAQPETPGAANLMYSWHLLNVGRHYKTPTTTQTTFIGIGDSKLYIGGLPSGERFRGTLDLIVFDPKGGGRL